MPRHIHQGAYDVRRAYVESIVAEYHKGLHLPLGPGPRLPSSAPPRIAPAETRPINKVAIVGGGVVGLRTAMMLESNFNVDVYEAGAEVGGRLYTHHFNGGGQWDYFDVGAMRFPETALMQPNFDLFDELDLRRSLLPYKISVDENVKAFNLERQTVGSLKAGPREAATRCLEDLISLLATDRAVGIAKPRTLDFHTTRSYLRESKGYPLALIDYIETMSFGTGCEIVFEELYFQYDREAPTDLDWYCVKWGSYEIIKKMKAKLESPEYEHTVTIKIKHRVTTAVLNNKAKTEGSMLTISGLNSSNIKSVPFSEQYSHVIFALPPPRLRTMGLSTCHLDYEQLNALRKVSIGPSCRVGIKFKSAWWTRSGIDIKGGQSTTDRMARTIVYTSYEDGKLTVLIANYSWTQDAVTLGAWIQGRKTPAEERLKELLLADLEYIHHGHITLEELNREYEDMFPRDWTHYPDSMGAFGVFDPDQYQQYYCALTRPAAGGHMHFIGESISTIHGWVAGALESAARGVMQVLELNQAATVQRARGVAEPAAIDDDDDEGHEEEEEDEGEDPLEAFRKR